MNVRTRKVGVVFLQAVMFLVLPMALKAQDPVLMPRLCGVVNVGKTRLALLVNPPAEPFHEEKYCVLAEGQREEQIEVLEILPKSATVRINLSPDAHGVKLTLTNRVGGADQKENGPGLILEQAPLELVLSLYAEFSGRTVLRSPRLEKQSITMTSSAQSSAAAAAAISQALKDQGMATIPDGTKFVMVVPQSKAALVKPRSSEVKPSAGNESEVLAPGTINFRGVDLRQFLAVYAELRDCKLDPVESRPVIPAGVIHIRTQTALTRAELVYAFDTLLGWNGVKMVPSGEGKLQAVAFPEGAR